MIGLGAGIFCVMSIRSKQRIISLKVTRTLHQILRGCNNSFNKLSKAYAYQNKIEDVQIKTMINKRNIKETNNKDKSFSISQKRLLDLPGIKNSLISSRKPINDYDSSDKIIINKNGKNCEIDKIEKYNKYEKQQELKAFLCKQIYEKKGNLLYKNIERKRQELLKMKEEQKIEDIKADEYNKQIIKTLEARLKEKNKSIITNYIPLVKYPLESIDEEIPSINVNITPVNKTYEIQEKKTINDINGILNNMYSQHQKLLYESDMIKERALSFKYKANNNNTLNNLQTKIVDLMDPENSVFPSKALNSASIFVPIK